MSAFSHSSFSLRASADDLDLAVLLIAPESAPKGIVQLVHGMCEHKERYIPFMEYLASNGYAAIIHDHRGHGASVKSVDDLGYMYDGGWKAMVEDIRIVNIAVRELYPELPVNLFGHSMGSLAVRSYLKRYPDTVSSLFVCGSPSDNPAKGVAEFMAASIGRIRGWHYRPGILQKLSFGAFNKPFEADGYPSAWVCSDKEILEAYHNDPLCQYVFTSNGFYNLMGLMKDCYSGKGWTLKDKSLPVHFISGAQDPCRTSDKAFNEAVEKIGRVGYECVTSRLYPGMRHEILNETDRMTVWSDVLSVLISN